MRLLYILVYLLLALVGVSFAALNASKVSLNLYFKVIQLPVSVLMVLVFGLGLFVGALSILIRYWRLKLSHKRIQHQLNIKEKEIKNLRTIPIQDQH